MQSLNDAWVYAEPEICPGPIIERKYWVEDERAPDLLAALNSTLKADSFTVAGGGSYAVHTLYFDTADLDVYHRTVGWRSARYRVRQYGSDHMAYLEVKARRNGFVRKQRTPVPASDLMQLSSGNTGPDWAGAWFARRLEAKRLQPVCQVSYSRAAYAGIVDGNPVRVTIDRCLFARRASSIAVPFTFGDGHKILDGTAVVEVKSTRPALNEMERLKADFALRQAPASKYRQSVAALRLADR